MVAFTISVYFAYRVLPHPNYQYYPVYRPFDTLEKPSIKNAFCAFLLILQPSCNPVTPPLGSNQHFSKACAITAIIFS